MVAAAIVGGAVVGGLASRSAARTQADAANNAANMSMDQYQQTRADQAPYRQAGYGALDMLRAGTSEGGYFNRVFTPEDLKANLAPNYDFMLKQGQQANQNAAGVNNGLVGGNALQGLNEFSQNYAQNAYQQAFNNFTANQSNIYNRLSNLAGLGQTANQATSTAGMNATNAATGYLTSGAAAQAAGTVGAANALNNGVGQYAAWNYLNK